MKTNAKITNETQRKVIAESISATYALATINDLWEVLEQFEGKKILKVDGSKTKAFSEAVAPFIPHYDSELNTNGYDVKAKPHRMMIKASYHSIIWACSNATYFGDTFFNDGSLSGSDFSYYEYELYIGKVNDQNELILGDKEDLIKKLQTAVNLSYTKDIKPIQQQIIEAKKLINELEAKIPYYARKLGYYSSL